MSFEGIRPVLHVPFADAPDQPIIEEELARLAELMGKTPASAPARQGRN